MSISKRVSEATSKLIDQDFEGALLSICTALEATAKSEYGSGGRSVYKQFIRDNLPLITRIGFGCVIESIQLKYDHAELKPNANGAVPIEDILYHVVRCGLYHDAAFPDNLRFEGTELKIEIDSLVIPQNLVVGLLIAVIASPQNADGDSGISGDLNVGPLPVPLRLLWGKKRELIWLLGVMNELQTSRKVSTEGSQAERTAGS